MKWTKYSFRLWFRRLDHHVLINYPIIWSIKGHYFFLFSFLLGNLLIATFSYAFPFSESSLEVDTSDGYDTAIFLFMQNFSSVALVIYTLIILRWAIYLHKYCPRVSALKKYNLILLCCCSLAGNILLPQMIMSNKVAQLEEKSHIQELESIFFDSYYCHKFEGSDKFILLGNQAYLLKSTKSYIGDDEIMKIDSSAACNKDSIGEYDKNDIIFLLNQKKLEKFSKYMNKYKLFPLQNNRKRDRFESKTLNRLLHQSTDSMPIDFPLIISEDNRVKYYYKPYKLIEQAQKSVFYTWVDWSYYVLLILVLVLPGIIFLLSESTFLEFSVSLVSFFLIIGLLFFSSKTDNSVSISLNAISLLVFYIMIYSMTKIMFPKGSRSLSVLWKSVGFYFIPLLFFFFTATFLDSFIDKKGIVLIISIIAYIFLTNVYFWLLITRRAKHPVKR